MLEDEADKISWANLIYWARSAPIGWVSFANFVVFSINRVLEPIVFGPPISRYPPEVLFIGGVLIFCILPYLIIKREDSGHNFAYIFSYLIFLILLLVDVDLFFKWISVNQA